MIRVTLLALTLLAATPALAQDRTEAANSTPAYMLSEAPTDHTMGSIDAPDTLILYASNVCPHCGSWFANDWPIVKSELVETGKLRLVFRPLPSAPIDLSLTGFLMAECAAADTYMTVIEDQFTRQSTILGAKDGATIKAQYDAIARVAGLEDPAAIAECLGTEAHFDTLQTSANRAGAAGITGIPSFIFNGEIMSGDNDAAAIMRWVDGN